MTQFIQIAGSPTTAVAILDSDGNITSTGAIATGIWSNSTKVENGNGRAAIMGGSTQNTTVALGSEVKYLTSLGNPKATWKTIAPAIAADPTLGGIAGDFKLGSIVGDPLVGFTVMSADGKTVYQVAAGATPAWKALTSPLPLNFNTITKIAGDIKNGILIISDDEQSKIARNGADCCSWIPLTPAPIKIDLITGDAAKGFVVYGEGQLYSLAVTASAATWAPLQSLNFGIVALSGNLTDGVVALIGDGNVVAYCKAVAKSEWNIALGPYSMPGSAIVGTAAASSRPVPAATSVAATRNAENAVPA